MTVFADISAALDARLNAMAGLPPVAWENTGYEPTTGTLFLRPTLLPADTAGATLSDTGTDEHIGVYQVDVFAPLGEGKAEAVAMADSIAEQFKPVTELTYNSRLVRCVAVSRGVGSRDDSWYQIPVTVSYLSYTTKR